MNPTNVPPWGTPWHGLVQGGVLTLPNGGTMAYPQPVSTSFTSGPSGSITNYPQDTYGITHRHAAGLPPVTSSAADIAAGREWRNEATLSGGRYQVYGKPLDGWVYIDPDGGRWVVKIPAIREQDARSLTSTLNVAVSFLKFGELGVAPALWPWSVTLPLPDIGASGSGYLMIDAIKPDGSAAVINVYSQAFTERRMGRPPIGFIEVSISGPASAPTITANVVRDKSQTQIHPPVIEAELSWWDGVEYQETNPLQLYAAMHSLEGEFASTSKWILALWYDALGSLHELILRAQATSTYSAPRPSNPDAGYTSSSSGSGTLDIMVDATVFDSMTFSVAVTAEQSGGAGIFTFAAEVDGVALAGDATVEPDDFAIYPFPDLGHMIPFLGTTAVGVGGAVHSLAIAPGGPYFTPITAATWFRASVWPYWHSRQVVGFEISTENGHDDPASRRWRFRPPVTPSGLAGGATIDITTPTGPTYYGSHDPYSGAAVWGQTEPVCYV